jgi:hypothetical protein
VEILDNVEVEILDNVFDVQVTKKKASVLKLKPFLIGGGETHSELLTPANCFFSSLIRVCYPTRLFNHV